MYETVKLATQFGEIRFSRIFYLLFICQKVREIQISQNLKFSFIHFLFSKSKRIWFFFIGPRDPHSPITMLVCIENSHNKCGGRAVPMSWLQQVGKACKELKLPLHCDGARLFNTAAALKVPAKELVKDCASVSVCLSKGLGTPVGSVIVGSHDFIGKAIRVRKALGQ